MSNNVTIILAAGNAVRFGGVFKQLLKIGDETILQRMIRQHNNRSSSVPAVVTYHAEIVRESYVMHIHYPERYSVTCETLMSTRSLWQDRTIVLLGDVVYSKDTMDRIYSEDKSLAVFGNTWEIFALSFDKSRHDEILFNLQLAIPHKSGKLRYFYKSFCGFDMDCEEKEATPLENEVFRYVHDWTSDVDSPHKYDNLLREVVNANRLDDLP